MPNTFYTFIKSCFAYFHVLSIQFSLHSCVYVLFLQRVSEKAIYHIHH
jgi:hypothetical protein